MSWFQLLCSTQGRLNRQGFWQGISFCLLLLFILANALPLERWFQQTSTAVLASSLLLVIFLFIACIVIKRLHDRGRTGKTVFIVILPILCYFIAGYSDGLMAWALGRFLPLFFLMLFILDWGVFKGQPDQNIYGDTGQALDWRRLY